MFLYSKRCLIFFILIVTVYSLSGCKSEPKPLNQVQEDTNVTEKIEGSLVFKNVTLDQSDKQGRPLWKVTGDKATYSPDRKIAYIDKPNGDLYQDGKLILQVSAQSGEILENGEIVFLKGQVTATDPRNGAVLRGDESEWKPKEDLLVIRNNVKGNHPKLQASAKEGRYLSRTQKLELIGQVAAISKDPNLQMKTERLLWQIEQQKVIGNKSILIERYKNKIVTERVEADNSEVNLKTNIATLKKNVQLTSVEPPVLISSNSAVWNLNDKTVVSDQPVRIVHQQEKLMVTANRGRVDLGKKVVRLTGGVQGEGSRKQAKLYANQLTWDIPTQQMEASGNVIYEQVSPQFNTTGDKAVGNLEAQDIVVTSGVGERVVTEIIP
ncbi:MAG: LPS export ABC transporter periplasmic protein LptC [Moorea sp. SIOASIH]|uniref:LPS export ABC transporter periplasmic protein LptC n=1 Tax=Moorena sp. SIOASIH TaxID=2607817 RepID=UPI0013BDFAFD|nr:LPS export ABC transporter periplasmic protein LptC [Moorena sp. SIOASIH]NEO35836.1 LPS export ABC transporter periplasmic protein LptC [Moorena sp. SIOASIH]